LGTKEGLSEEEHPNPRAAKPEKQAPQRLWTMGGKRSRRLKSRNTDKKLSNAEKTGEIRMGPPPQ